MADLWNGFSAKFLALWDAKGQQPVKERQQAFMAELLRDTIAFAGGCLLA